MEMNHRNGNESLERKAKKSMDNNLSRTKSMKKVLISIIGFLVIAVLVGCSSLDFSGGGSNGSEAGSQASRGVGNQANNGSRVTPARPPAARNDPTKTDAELVAEAIKWGIALFSSNIPKRKTLIANWSHRQQTP